MEDLGLKRFAIVRICDQVLLHTTDDVALATDYAKQHAVRQGRRIEVVDLVIFGRGKVYRPYPRFRGTSVMVPQLFHVPHEVN